MRLVKIATSKLDAGCAALVESVARDFGDEFGGSAARALSHQFEEIARFGRGVERGTSLAGDVIFDGADEYGLAVGGVQQRFGEKCRSRLAVGAGDAGGGELALRVAEERGGCLGECAAAVLDFERRESRDCRRADDRRSCEESVMMPSAPAAMALSM